MRKLWGKVVGCSSGKGLGAELIVWCSAADLIADCKEWDKELERFEDAR